MGDPDNPLTLPPGCRFYPSDEQIVCCYLFHKNNGDSDSPFGFDVIKEIDLYNYEPFDLPESCCFRFGRGGRKRHWYCYTRVLKRNRRWRVSGGGFWRRKGPIRNVVGSGGGNIVVGTRKNFVYYLGDSPKTAVKTDWVMYEYSLIDQKLTSFVLCRVFVKSVRRNSISDHVISSCGEESVATFRRVGVQHDGTVRLGFSENKICNAAPLDQETDTSRFAVAHGYELKDIGSNVPVGGQTRSSGHINGLSQLTDSLSAEELMAIREEDYIELDDLLFPFPDVD